MKTDFEKVKTCDLCRSQKNEWFLTSPDRKYQTGIFKYVRCKNCGLIWLSPRPKASNLSKYYPPENYRPYLPLNKPTKAQTLIRKLVKNNRTVARILIKDQLFFSKNKGKILDVGPGSGYYLTVLKGWGWQVYGLELNEKAFKLAKKTGIKNIKLGDLFSAKYQDNFFDVVRFSHVLEHVPSPKKELKETKRILKKGGSVLIIVPNINSLFFKIFKSHWYPLEPPRHFFQFTPETTTRLLRNLGFREIKIKYNQSPHTFLWSLLYVLGLHNIDKRTPTPLYPLAVILRFLNILKLSDVIEVTARKL